MISLIADKTPFKVFATTLSDHPWCPPGVAVIGAHREWTATRGEGVVVALVDSGVDYHHPDLKNQIADGKSFVKGKADYYDENGHGTHVAGIVAANGRLLGVAPASKLLVARVLDEKGEGDPAQVAQALDWVASWRGPKGERVSVVNLSLGMSRDDAGLHQAVAQAYQEGIALIAAAGNEGDADPGTSEYSYPAYWPEVLAVGAVDLTRRAASFTNTNDHIGLVAPGVDTYSTYPGGKYVLLSGTSMASPHIAGAAALVHARHLKAFGFLPDPEWTYRYLRLHTIDLGRRGYDDLYGFGLFSFNPSGGSYLSFSTRSTVYRANGERKTLKFPILRSRGMAYLSLADLKDMLKIDYEWFGNEGKLEVWD